MKIQQFLCEGNPPNVYLRMLARQRKKQQPGGNQIAPLPNTGGHAKGYSPRVVALIYFFWWNIPIYNFFVKVSLFSNLIGKHWKESWPHVQRSYSSGDRGYLSTSKIIWIWSTSTKLMLFTFHCFIWHVLGSRRRRQSL